MSSTETDLKTGFSCKTFQGSARKDGLLGSSI